ncbi:TetR/AcrR family transcriptional regulator [Staphylococcus nepalensis]|uniref:TetR/AcrR family transcriptional regulator n=1 Tax=Staphylococcus nepalensis TaxID=214473 RepID=UPI0031BB0F9E
MKHEQDIKIDVELILNNQEITFEKKKILTSSIHLFTKYGYESTTINNIAKHARIKKDVFSKYFNNKHDLLLAIITPIIDHCIPLYEDIFIEKLEDKKGNKLKSLVHFLVNDRIRFFKQNFDIINILFSRMIVDDEIKELLVSHLEISHSNNNTIFEVFQKTDELAPDIDYSSFIRITMGQLSAYFIQAFILKNTNISQKQLEIQIYRSLKNFSNN